MLLKDIQRILVGRLVILEDAAESEEDVDFTVVHVGLNGNSIPEELLGRRVCYVSAADDGKGCLEILLEEED